MRTEYVLQDPETKKFFSHDFYQSLWTSDLHNADVRGTKKAVVLQSKKVLDVTGVKCTIRRVRLTLV